MMGGTSAMMRKKKIIRDCEGIKGRKKRKMIIGSTVRNKII
jgi:hypothetical protein